MHDRPGPTLPIYEPPSADEPLDAIELAWVHALISDLVREIREEMAAGSTDPDEAAAR